MRVSVRAGEVREGDRLIVPDGEIEVPKGFPTPFGDSDHVCLVPWGGSVPIMRHRDERVVVERPDPPITITVELTEAEADAYLLSVQAMPLVAWTVAIDKVRAAIVAARAGETTP